MTSIAQWQEAQQALEKCFQKCLGAHSPLAVSLKEAVTLEPGKKALLIQMPVHMSNYTAQAVEKKLSKALHKQAGLQGTQTLSSARLLEQETCKQLSFHIHDIEPEQFNTLLEKLATTPLAPAKKPFSVHAQSFLQHVGGR